MIKKLIRNLFLAILMINSFITYGQSKKQQLIAENQQGFINNLISQKSGKPTTINLSKNESLSLIINVKKQTNQSLTLIGMVNNEANSTFSLSKVEGKLVGDIVLQASKKAYKVFTASDDKVYIEEVDIHKILCIDFEKSEVDEKEKTNTPISSKMALELESLPGALGIIYLDFDGEVVENTRWDRGNRIDAASPNFSDDRILRVWKIMAEDFRPYNFNVTTRRDLYDAAPQNRRMMCIFTPTDTAAPRSGGVAYVRSFSSNRFDDPCWVYNLGSARAAGDTGSHEVGHTLGLGHDGAGTNQYYSGHGKWAPIMGTSIRKEVAQWSLGEYENASQSQDDIAIIGDNTNGVGFLNDDHGDVISDNASTIKVDSDGGVSPDQNFGLINNRDDKDVFSFVAESGDVSFSFNPDPDYPNLNIQARILNALGEEVAISNPPGLNASINTNLTAGTYFIEIDGVGEGTPFNGYSDYASLGNYFISGNYTPGNNQQPPVANFEATKNDCSTVTFKSTTINKVNSYLWDFGDGITSTEQSPSHTYETGGTFTVSLTATNDIGENTNKKTDFVVINIPEQPKGDNQNICPGESTTVIVSGNSEYQWYTQPTGGTAIATGAIYETPILNTTQTYYVSGIIDDCITKTRTEIKAVVIENPTRPTITVNQGQKLAIDSQYASYQWFLNEEAIIDGTQGTHLPQKIGEYKIEVANEADCKITSEVFVVDQSQLNLSLSNKIFTFYPNPIKEEELLNIDGITSNDYDLRIVNILGQILIQSEPNATVDVSDLSKGLYIILINNKAIGKFIKK